MDFLAGLAHYQSGGNTPRLADPLLTFETRTPSYFYGLLLFTLAEVETGFQNTRRIAVAVVHMFTGFHGS